MFTVTRRTLLGGVGAAALASTAPAADASAIVVVDKDPNCGCCSGWVAHLQAAGFETRVVDVGDLASVKTRLGVPSALESCHTAEVGGYVIEGHVPARMIRRLLSQKPAAVGLAVPGMPAGSPGMEVPGAADEVYEIILFTRSGQKVYGRFKGAEQLA